MTDIERMMLVFVTAFSAVTWFIVTSIWSKIEKIIDVLGQKSPSPPERPNSGRGEGEKK